MTLVWRPGFQFDDDASTYIEAVEAADTQALETGVRYAINDFVIGCKNDGIWDAIKASCILAGARTLDGALVPLVGTAPTNYNFVAGDYDRETGLIGDGTRKYLDSNRSNNADPQNSKHVSAYITTAQTNSSVFLGISTSLNVNGDLYMYSAKDAISSRTARINSTSGFGVNTAQITGLAGVNRSASSGFIYRINGIDYAANDSSAQPISESIHVFKGGNQFANPRLAFYSIGESLDLAALDTRVSDLITAIGAAIP